jgi:hypothetical protein
MAEAQLLNLALNKISVGWGQELMACTAGLWANDVTIITYVPVGHLYGAI